MGIGELEDQCQRLAPELFCFIHIFIEDRSLCEELLWSTFESVHIDNLGPIHGMMNDGKTPEKQRNYRIGAFKQAYILADKEVSIKELSHQNLFNTLSAIQKAVVYLRHRTTFSFQEMADIVEKEKTDVCSLLYGAREQLISFSRTSLEEECFYSRQIPALVDLGIEDNRFYFLRKHALKCTSCANLYAKVLHTLESIAKMMPIYSFPKKLQHTFEITLKKLLKETLPKKEKWGQKAKRSVPLFLRDLFKAVTTKSFLISSCIVALVVLIFRLSSLVNF